MYQKRGDLNGLCDRPEGLDPRKIQDCVWPYQTATDLLRRCASRRRPALFFAPGPGNWQRGGPDYGVRHAAGLPAGPVRAPRPAP